MSERCPECGAQEITPIPHKPALLARYHCGSEITQQYGDGELPDVFCQDCRCLRRQRDQWEMAAFCLEAENKALRKAIPEPKRLCEIADWIERVHGGIVAVYNLRIWASRAEVAKVAERTEAAAKKEGGV